MGIDWHKHFPKENSTLPILAVVPGIVGHNDETYLDNIYRDVGDNYNCVVINYRTGSGV